ncbi:guanylate kinase [Methylococcus capsulatus]|jgi:guanylate kinase|uniref:Guanylate kinase n=1 Tax=Methylococcus capsulatus TaxID=414 RepID=A0AA35UQ52_METCP|nr:guanylate kinase [Methylococcus capsulatus]CAI8804572.1 guanylate kinase [Methylococcus capsulatus]
MTQGLLYVISAPSGAGKTSLVSALCAGAPDLAVSVSHTTRPQRPGEMPGQDYWFVDKAEFEKMIANEAFLEYARVFDNYYGTAKTTVEEVLASGRDAVLEIDWQGARQVRRLMPACVSVFILPPSRQALEQRLRTRQQDSEAVIARRMEAAISEMSHYAEYDYLIVNDDFNLALNQLRAIVQTQRLTVQRQAPRLGRLIADLLG